MCIPVLCLLIDCWLLESFLFLFLILLHNFIQGHSIISSSLLYFVCISSRFAMCLGRGRSERQEKFVIPSQHDILIGKSTSGFLLLLPSKKRKRKYIHLYFTISNLPGRAGFHPKVVTNITAEDPETRFRQQDIGETQRKFKP